MIIFKKAKDISLFLDGKKSGGNTIGFVPTMGALHEGHLSLIQLSRQQTGLTVCSIFINPTQFNNQHDFIHYPVTIEKDIELLVQAGCDVLFLPPVAEIYPGGFPQKHYDLGSIETILEGYYRPGHFQGVCQVVERLLDIVRPDRMFLGQKDYQQCMVVKRLLEITGRKDQPELVIAPTVRETDGLAMSSRNLRLTDDERRTALAIYNTLTFIKNNLNGVEVDSIKEEAKKRLEENGFDVDYVEIADAQTLAPATPDHRPKVALIAATLNKVRLIDNMILN